MDKMMDEADGSATLSNIFFFSSLHQSISSARKAQSLPTTLQAPKHSTPSMASFTMAASFTGTSTVSQRPSMNRPGVFVAKLAKPEQTQKVASNPSESSIADKSRRNVVFAAAAAAICSVAYGNQASIAAVEPKPGTPEAKKLYAPVCVTMPTARICHK